MGSAAVALCAAATAREARGARPVPCPVRASRWTRCGSPSGSVAALPKCNPVQSEPPPLQQSIKIQAVRGRTTFTAGHIDAHSSGTRVPSEDAHHPSSRPTLPHSLTSDAERAAADQASSARRRSDELLAGGASRISSRTTTGPAARSGPGQCASSSMRRRSVIATAARTVPCGACGSLRKAPRTGFRGRADG